MDDIEQIRQMVREGKLSPGQGEGLIRAYEEAQHRDSEVQKVIHEQHAGRRRTFGWLAGTAVLLCVVGGSLMASYLCEPKRPIQETEIFPVPPPGSNTDETIQRLEREAREPNGGRHYLLLSSLYQMRYSQTGDLQDQRRADEAQSRAQRYQRRQEMKTNPAVFLLATLILIVGILGAIAMFLYNGLAKSDERCDRQWGQIQAQLQRRMDLVPALVDSVKTYMKHEQETLIAVTEARNRALGSLSAAGMGKDKAAVEQMDKDQQMLGASLSRLMMLVEKYPDLKANQSFLTLQDQLEGTENRIATERMRYNDIVGTFNEKTRTFPSNMIGSMFGFESRQYFEAKLDAEEAPALKFKE